MKTIAAMIAERQIDLRGCEYHESQQLTHIDGFLVYYHDHGRLILSTDLTDKEKLQGVQRLLSQLNQQLAGQPQLYFWTKTEAHEAQAADGPAAQLPSSDASADQQATSSFVTTAGTKFFNLTATNDEHKPSIPLLRVPRTFLPIAVRTIIDQPRIRGWSAEQAHTFVEEPITIGGYVYLSLLAPMNAPWSIEVRITTQVQGRLHLTLGSHSFHGTLTIDGITLLNEIEPELLLAAEGPDLELWLEPAPDPGDAQM